MRAGMVGLVGVMVLAVGCAGGRRSAKGDPVAHAQEPNAGRARYVDESLGFEVVRPSSAWELDISGEPVDEGMATPVVLRNPQSGAQVVIQVAPAVAPPVQLAERLTAGMRTHPGFVTSDPEPLPLSDSAVGFRFSMGDTVLGRVAVREGAPGRVLMMLATWPSDATEATRADVDDLFRSVQPVDVAQ